MASPVQNSLDLADWILWGGGCWTRGNIGGNDAGKFGRGIMFGLRNGGVGDWMLANLSEPTRVDGFLSSLASALIFA